jgi:indoleacetamide hydrolase
VARDGLGIGLPELIAQMASPDVREMFSISAAQVPAMQAQYLAAVARVLQLRSLYEQLLSLHALDAVVYPTTPLCAFAIGESPNVLPNVLPNVTLNGRELPVFQTLVRHTSPASVAGVPSVSLPAGRCARGLPVGLQVEAAFGQDRKLLAVCAVLESLFAGRSAAPSAVR